MTTSKKRDILHLASLKQAVKDLQKEKDNTEHQIEKVSASLATIKDQKDDNKLYSNTIYQSYFDTKPWPPGSNPFYRTKDRKEEENNYGWIR